MKAKVLFYHWDWREQPDIEDIQRAIATVFDGSNAPFITGDVPTADWDQHTVGICSARIDPKLVGEAFEQYNESDDDCWWDLDKAPVPLEIDVP